MIVQSNEIKKSRNGLAISFCEIVLCIFAVQAFFLETKCIVFHFYEETLFARCMVTMVSMLLVLVVFSWVWNAGKTKLNLFPKEFANIYIIATVIALLFFAITLFWVKKFTLQNLLMIVYSGIATPVFEELFPYNTFQRYFSADVMALYNGKWLFCMHKERATWEHPSGWIEEGETPLEAAKRELYEETGAVAFDIEPLCDYSIDGELGGYHYNGNGQVYFAVVHTLGEIPLNSEMGKIGLFDSLPEELTYPILRDSFEIAVQMKQSKFLLSGDSNSISSTTEEWADN